MEPYLKVAQISDIDILMSFMRKYYEFDQIPLEETAAYRALEQLLQDRSLGRTWLIYADDKPVGYVVLTLGFSLEYHGRDAFIDEIYIDEAYRGQGIGAKTLAFVEAEAGALGVQALHLEVEQENHKARNFYGKIGFQGNNRLLLSKRITTEVN